VPELSRFYGIIVRMYAEPFARHHRPHFHVDYQDASAVYALDPIELMAGTLPTRQRRLIEAWAELHADELMQDWRLLQAGRPPQPIAPLQ
jgi:hypothetical protein